VQLAFGGVAAPAREALQRAGGSDSVARPFNQSRHGRMSFDYRVETVIRFGWHRIGESDADHVERPTCIPTHVAQGLAHTTRELAIAG